MKRDLLYILTIIILSIALSVICFKSCNKADDKVITKIDTLIVRDTLTFVKRITDIRYDTIIITDTVTNEQIVYVKDDPIVYSDTTENYKLDIEAVKLYGYSLDIYKSDTVYKIETVKQSFWKNRFYIGVGIGCQYGVINRQFDVGPQIQFGFRIY